MPTDFFTDKIYSLYHTEVGKHPVLTPKQERDLLCKYHVCLSCGERFPPTIRVVKCPACRSLTAGGSERVYTCTTCTTKFDANVLPQVCKHCGTPRDMKARDSIVVSNLRFVVRRAKALTSNPEHIKRLISAGNVGLLMAVDRFNVSCNTRFLTYAAWWIRKEMIDEIHSSRIVYVPTYRQKSLQKEVKLGKYVCVYCGARTHDINETLPNTPCVDDEEHLFELPLDSDATNLQPPISLDALTPSDCVTQGQPDIEDDVITTNTEDVLRYTLRKLNFSERDLFIFMAYFGIPQGERKTEPKSLHQLAALTGITTERVRQVKEIKLKRVRTALKKTSAH